MSRSQAQGQYANLSYAPKLQECVVHETPSEYGASTVDFGFPEADAVHELLKNLHTISNEVRLQFLDALKMMFDGNLCYELGYSNFQQYCDREFGLARSTSLEYIRAAEALVRLPRLRVLFGQGELSWQQVRAITRVATFDTETQWIELAFQEPVRELLAEVREAQRTGKDAPREKRHGLPNLIVSVAFDMTLEEKERVRAAFARVNEALSAVRGATRKTAGNGDSAFAESPDPRTVLVRWADGILSGAISAGPTVSGRAAERGREGEGGDEVEGEGGGTGQGKGERRWPRAASARAERPAPAQTILYRTCPQCREATLETEDGVVNIAPERIAELAAESNKLEIALDEELVVEVLPEGEIDVPNTSRLARKVLHRDGLRCANPGCEGRRHLTAHHIVFRSKGGPTVLANEVSACEVCHSLLHHGRLEVTGTPGEGLAWKPRPTSTAAKIRDAEALRARLRDLVVSAPTSVGPIGVLPGRRAGLSTDVDAPFQLQSLPHPQAASPANITARLSDLALGLKRLGWTRAESELAVRRAYETLAEEYYASGYTPQEAAAAPTDEQILIRALKQ